MTKLLTLEEWAQETYKSKQPTPQTLQCWARGGNIYPAPESMGEKLGSTQHGTGAYYWPASG
ncbi:excisionase [Yersinia canariae]|uniref:excisionase n=1 Tax=Yersinia canariae TaxID=2607663 RepID=UPI00286E5B41|nr:excisionase [Yersinia canariae]